MPATTYTPTRPATWTDASSLTLPFARTRTKIVVLVIATTLAFTFRVSGLSTYGFSEDELNKVTAIEQYRAGRFSANAEPPMLMKLAVFCYERAKRAGVTDVVAAQRWYTASGAAFGLMLASKYMPHYLGIYAVFNVLTDREAGANKPDRLRHYGAMAAAFAIANVAIALPETWRYIAGYVRGDMLAHHGYSYAGALYVTAVPVA